MWVSGTVAAQNMPWLVIPIRGLVCWSVCFVVGWFMLLHVTCYLLLAMGTGPVNSFPVARCSRSAPADVTGFAVGSSCRATLPSRSGEPAAYILLTKRRGRQTKPVRDRNGHACNLCICISYGD